MDEPVVAPWMLKIKVGDLLISGTGTLRIVRQAHVWQKHSRSHVAVGFAIRRCSWTGRCYTIYNHNDLKQYGYRPTGKRYKGNTTLDKEIKRNIEESEYRTVKCCDVIGIP